MKRVIMCCIVLSMLEGNGLAGDFTVKLTCPSKLLRDEYRAEFKVAISNGTTSTIRIFEKAGNTLDSLVFFRLESQEHMEYCLLERHLPRTRTNSWGRLSTNTSSYDTRLLTPGQTHEWNFASIFSPLREGFVPDFLNITQMGLYAQVLVGPDQWVCSNTNKVSISTQGIEDGIGTVLFTTSFPTMIGQCVIEVREVLIDNDRFLFSDFDRICKISATVTPSFAIDAGASDILIVTFDDNSPTVRFNMRTGKIVP